MSFQVLDAKTKKVVFDKVEQAKGLGMIKGIMFKPKEFTPLLFDFDVEGRMENAIHSLFCPPFNALFLNRNKEVVWGSNIRDSRFFYVPPVAFRYLIESPYSIEKMSSFRIKQKLEW